MYPEIGGIMHNHLLNQCFYKITSKELTANKISNEELQRIIIHYILKSEFYSNTEIKISSITNLLQEKSVDAKLSKNQLNYLNQVKSILKNGNNHDILKDLQFLKIEANIKLSEKDHDFVSSMICLARNSFMYWSNYYGIWQKELNDNPRIKENNRNSDVGDIVDEDVEGFKEGYFAGSNAAMPTPGAPLVGALVGACVGAYRSGKEVLDRIKKKPDN